MISNVADRNAVLQTVLDIYTGQTLQVWSGAEPASPDTTPAGVLLFSITMPSPSFTAPANGSMGKQGIWKVNSAAATGVPSFYRMISSVGPRMQGSAAMNSGAELIITDPENATAAEVLANRAVEVVSVTITQP